MLRPILCRVALLIAGLVSIPQLAVAANELVPERHRPMIRVGLADLDLSRTADVSTLNDRVRMAARRLCANELKMASPLERRACVKGAIRDSRPQIEVAIAGSGDPQLGRVIEVRR